VSRDARPLPLDAAGVSSRVIVWVAVLAALLVALGGACVAAVAPGVLRVSVLLATIAGVGVAGAAIFQLHRLRAHDDASHEEADATDSDWNGNDRRGPNRARNVARLPKKATGDTTAGSADADDDQWESF